jgi:UDP-N-acetyl-D-galactosamine dehydrogenase
MDMDLYDSIVNRQAKIAVIGLGYVGLPLAVAFSAYAEVIGYDVNSTRVDSCLSGIDPTDMVGDEALQACSVRFTTEEEELAQADFYIVTVPTPVQRGNIPDLTHVWQASVTIGRSLKPGNIVVYESTVYPGVTEEICIPILEAESGLQGGRDFKVGYSPERMNPGDRVHRLENVVKLVSGMDEEALAVIASVYELVVNAGVYRVESIKIAEAAKVIENAQRDVNIAFMNELSVLFNHMDIPTQAVLAAAGTKWNFLNFTPGLVGGHCIGVDPYYLSYKAEELGSPLKIIAASREINDGMGKYVAQQIVKRLVKQKQNLSTAKIGFLGLSYKENSADIRNTKVIDIIQELEEYGIATQVVDPVADKGQVYKEYGIELAEVDELRELSAVVVAVPHSCFAELAPEQFTPLYGSNERKLFIDVKGYYDKNAFEHKGYDYWSL